jgi:hypothetical protein
MRKRRVSLFFIPDECNEKLTGRKAEGACSVAPVRTLAAIRLTNVLFLRESLPDRRIASTDDRVRRNALQVGFEAPPLLRLEA